MNTLVDQESLYSNPWFYVRKPNPTASLRLFCFSYAGGSAAAYRDWCNFLSDSIEVVCVQLPGRGARFREPTISCQNLLLDALEPEISPYLDRPFAFFGHSMGAQVAFDLVRRLRKAGDALPVQLMVSGRRAPQMPAKRKPIHALPEKEFLNEIKNLNGTPEEAMQHPELMELVSPILRADCKLVETWNYREEEPLRVAVTAFGGTQDKAVGEDHLSAWKVQTRKHFNLYLFEGDHFYINHQKPQLLRKIDNILSPIAKGYAQYAYRSNRGSEASIA